MDIELVIKIPEIEYEYITNKEKFYSLEKSKQEWLINKTLNRLLEQETVPKEIYTKTDIAAMLTELQLEIGYEAWTIEYPDGSHETIVDIESVSKIIQQKIDKYKTETESQEYKPRKSEKKKSDDCVSRQAVIEALKDNRYSDTFCDEHGIDRSINLNMSVIAVCDLPPARPVHGICKDCSHRDPEDKKCDCGHSIIWQMPRSDDWYCKDFEKRGNIYE